MSLTSFRAAIQAELEKDLAVGTVAFPIEGPLEDRDLVAVWIEGASEVSGAVQEQEITVRVRAFKLWSPVPDQVAAPDVAPLEALMETIQSALKDIQVSAAIQATGVWMFRTTTIVPVYEMWAVDAEIVATQQNPFLR